MSGKRTSYRRRVLCIGVVGVVGGVAGSVGSAWVVVLRDWPEITAVWHCIRAWHEPGGMMGVEMAWQLENWVPMKRSRVFSERGFIVRKAGDDPEWPGDSGPHVRFTEGDTYVAGMDPDAVHAGPPDWFVDGARSLELDDAVGGIREAAGWPCICLEGFTVFWGRSEPEAAVRRWWSSKLFGGAELPLRPVWPGMAVNIAVWGSASVVAVEGVRFVWTARRRFRRARGLCERCGYSRRGLDGEAVCPECGKGSEG